MSPLSRHIVEFPEITCVRSGHRWRDSYSLPCDGLHRGDHYVLLRAFRDAEPELVHGDALEVQDDAQRASACDVRRRSEGHDGCCRPCR